MYKEVQYTERHVVMHCDQCDAQYKRIAAPETWRSMTLNRGIGSNVQVDFCCDTCHTVWVQQHSNGA